MPTPEGQLKEADTPTPLANVFVPLPIENTVPEGTTLRILLFLWSATKMLPLASTSAPNGMWKEAAVPVPVPKVAVPLPAMVVTAPPGETMRRRWLSLSATMTLPPALMTTPDGCLKTAAAPCPSAHPAAPLPASVLVLQ